MLIVPIDPTNLPFVPGRAGRAGVVAKRQFVTLITATKGASAYGLPIPGMIRARSWEIPMKRSKISLFKTTLFRSGLLSAATMLAGTAAASAHGGSHDGYSGGIVPVHGSPNMSGGVPVTHGNLKLPPVQNTSFATIAATMAIIASARAAIPARVGSSGESQ